MPYIYIFAIVISIYLIKNKLIIEKKYNINVMFLVVLLLSIVSASFGIEALIDRRSYSYMFLTRFPSEINSFASLFNNSIEPGYILFNVILYFFTDNTFWLFFFVTFFSISVELFVIYKLSTKPNSNYIYYIVSLQVFFTFYLCRQSLASAFIALSFYFFSEQKYGEMALFIAIACMFHITAIILIPVYLIFVLSKKYGNVVKYTIILLLVCFIIYEPLTKLVMSNQILYSYLGDLDFIGLQVSKVIALKGLPFHLITIFALYHRREIRNKTSFGDIYILAAIFNSAFWFFSIKMYWLYRLSMYLIVPSLLLVPFLFEIGKQKYKYNYYKISIFLSMILITIREVFITLS